MNFIIMRVVRAVLTMVLVVTAVFFASRISGNPIDIMFPEGLSPEEYAFWENYFGLDKSYFQQYLAYLKSRYRSRDAMRDRHLSSSVLTLKFFSWEHA